MRAIVVLLLSLLPALAAPPAPPEILPRAAWGALPADVRGGAMQPIGRVRHVTVHHTAVETLRGGTAEAELRLIQRDHLQRGWGDIAYHYLIAPDGRIFAGRAPEFAAASGTRYLSEAQWRSRPVYGPEACHPDPARNRCLGGTDSLPEASTGPAPGQVQGHLTVCLLGNFMAAEPTPAAREALAALCAHLLVSRGLGAEDLWVHREVAATACPGDRLYAQLRAWPHGDRYAPGPLLEGIRKRMGR